MRKAFIITAVALIALISASCGSGPNKAFNKEYNIKPGHPMTGKCIEMVRDDLHRSEPAAKIVKYTDVTDIHTENATSHSMYVQVKSGGDVRNRTYYFPDDYSFVTQQLDRLVRYQLGIPD